MAAPNNLEDICVAGITPFTTIDFPGLLAGVFYLQGCPWRCRYCYNSEFWPMPPVKENIAPEKVLRFLHSRIGHLEGIVFSGGEPTIHKSLPCWLRAVREMGFQTGLHTAGAFPEMLREVLPLCDWVGMDIKAPFDLYQKITLISGSGAAARRSAEILMASKVPHEFRTTVHPDLLSEEDVFALVRDLVSLGSRRHVLQAFRPDHCQDKELRESASRDFGISSNLRSTLKTLLEDLQVRGDQG